MAEATQPALFLIPFTFTLLMDLDHSQCKKSFQMLIITNQSDGSVDVYNTKMKCVWEELYNLNVLPVISEISNEISVFLAALNKQKEEQRLFQFLNGMDDHYSHQRSQILMITPLPNVENACSLLQISKNIV
ncbi:hypothetical protein CTI12_AA415330 [Artemisia annua]|uniref:Uncharacterized protein n=1 Tax=Artemisia annua TaxID=35608 RepID=A0A2U1M135_ARTAN|nr:hypothetical protein CTI12_AA415330 [Artemisia annua]